MDLAKRLEKVFEQREVQSLIDFSTDHICITSGSALGRSGKPIPWNPNLFTPQLFVMDQIAKLGEDGRWRSVTLVTPPQVGGKTVVVISSLLYQVVHMRKSVLYVHCSDTEARRTWDEKIKPVIAADDLLDSCMCKGDDSGHRGDRRFVVDGVDRWFRFRGAESAAALTGFTIDGIVVIDDMHAMSERCGSREDHPSDVALERMGADPAARRIVKVGQTGEYGGRLHADLLASTHFRPYLPCMKCGAYQEILWSKMEFDDNDPLSAMESCRMRCEKCSNKIHHKEIPGMLNHIRFVSHVKETLKGEEIIVPTQKVSDLDSGGKVTGDLPKTRDCGIWWNAFIWFKTDWGVLAADYVESRGDPDKELSWKKTQEGTFPPPPKIDEDALTYSLIIDEHVDKKKGHEKGECPEEVKTISVGVDVQETCIYYAIWGFSDEGSAWLIDADRKNTVSKFRGESDAEKNAKVIQGISEGLEWLYDYLHNGWKDEKLTASYVFVDSNFHTDTVRAACALRDPTVWWPIVGAKKFDAPILPSRSSESKKHRGRYLSLGVSQGKLFLREMLKIPSGKPGHVRIYRGANSEKVAKHLASEQLVPVGWSGDRAWRISDMGMVKAKNNRTVTFTKPTTENHILDSTVYAYAAAIKAKVRFPSLKRSMDDVVHRTSNSGRERSGPVPVLPQRQAMPIAMARPILTSNSPINTSYGGQSESMFSD